MTQPVVIVTGASRGIGKAVTLSAIQHFNANVVAVARSKDLLDNLKEEVGKIGKSKSLEVVVGDLTDDKIAIRAVDRAIDRWGRLDGLVANAG
jgi:NADP-dependent 3-hydroxy acid dehydrogenase YdfG